MDCSNKCNIPPIPKECRDYCFKLWLDNTTDEEKQLILGLSTLLIKNIDKAYNSSGGVDSFADIESWLGPAEVIILRRQLRSLNQYQLNYVNSSPGARESVVDAIRKLKLGRDPDDDNFEGIIEESKPITGPPVYHT